MKILYIANARIPTERAHGLHIVKMCEAFAGQGVEVALVLPRRKNAILEDIFSYYGIKRDFIVQYLPIFDFVSTGFVGYWLTQLFFSWKSLKSSFDKKEYVVITRDELSGWIMRKRGFCVFYDMHGFPVKWKIPWKIAMKKMTGIICTNQWKIEQCEKQFGISLEKLLLARNGFDEMAFTVKLTKKDAREKLNLPVDRLIVMYSGHLYDWKGVGTIILSAKLAPEVFFVLIGGNESEVNILKRKHELSDNVLMVGQRPHKEISDYLQAADILLLPNSIRSANPRFAGYSAFDTSPIKMFEYLASGRPIIASDLPAIREVLNEKNSFLVTPDDPALLDRAIKDFSTNKEKFDLLAKQGLEDVREFTWEKRAKKIIEFIKKLS